MICQKCNPASQVLSVDAETWPAASAANRTRRVSEAGILEDSEMAWLSQNCVNRSKPEPYPERVAASRERDITSKKRVGSSEEYVALKDVLNSMEWGEIHLDSLSLAKT